MSRPRILLLSPLPPPAGGTATWTQRILSSELGERFDLLVVDTNVGVTHQKARIDPVRLKVAARVAAGVAGALLGRHRPCVVHINTPGRVPGVLRDATYARLAKAAGCAVIVHFRGSRFEALRARPALYRAFRRLTRSVDTFLVLNAQVKQQMEAAGFHNVAQVSNFVPTRPHVDRSQRASTPVRFLYVGWIMEAKGIYEMLQALAGVPEARLALLGRFVDDIDAQTEARVRETAADLGVSDRVELLGEVPLEAVWAHYEAADVFLLPSYSEGFPNVLLEAMMSGLPAIATPVGAIPDVVENGRTGLLVPVADAAALQAAMQHLAADAALRREMGDAAFERANARYAEAAVVRSIAAHYDRLIAGR